MRKEDWIRVIETNDKIDSEKQAGGELSKIIASIPRAFGLVWHASPSLTIALFVTTVISAFFPAGILWLTKMIIDQTATLMESSAAGQKIDMNPLWWLMGVLAAAWIANRLMDAVNNGCSNLLAFRVGNHTQALIMQKCSALDLAFFENPKNMDMVENASQGARMSAWNLLWILFSLVRILVTLGTFLTILFRLHWIAMVVVAVSTLPELMLAPYFAKRRWKMMTNRANDSRLCFYISTLITQRDPAKEIRVFGLSDYLIERFKFYWAKFFQQEIEFTRLRQISSLGVGILGFIATAFVWVYVIIRAVARTATMGDIILYTQAVENCQSSLIRLFNTGSDLYQQSLFLGNLFSLLDMNPTQVAGALQTVSGSNERSGKRLPSLPLKKGIEFRNVSFRYPGNDKWILQDLSFHIPVQESVALVGRNGAGKTTLVKLLVRLYDPTEGEILLDGVNIREYDLGKLRNVFGVIFQDYARYSLTLRENIGFGEIEWVADMDRIRNASAKAGADEIAQRLPNQYDSYLGKQFHLGRKMAKLGEDLSGGEWQKVALARAYMRESPVLILDEPTASLDAFAEFEIFKHFAEMAAQKTILLISHRFSTVRMANKILVLDGGRLVEEGRHEDLVADQKLYHSMFELQAERYR